MLIVIDKATGRVVSSQSDGQAYETDAKRAVKLSPEQVAAYEAARKELRKAGRSDFDLTVVDGEVVVLPDPRPYFRVEVSASLVVWGSPVTVTFTALDDAKGQAVVEAFGELWLAPGSHEWTPDRTGRYSAYSTADVRFENPVEITVARG